MIILHRNKSIIFSINERRSLKYQRWDAVSERSKENNSHGSVIPLKSAVQSFMLCLMHCAVSVCVREMESCSWYFSFSFLECFKTRNSAVLFLSSVPSPFAHVAAKSRRLNESGLSGWTESVEAFTGSSNESSKRKNITKPTWLLSLGSVRVLP